MTYFERIKQLSADELARFIDSVDDNGDFSAHVMCSYVCEYKKDGRCTYPDEEGCATIDVSPKDCIKMWLDTEEKETEWWKDTI